MILSKCINCKNLSDVIKQINNQFGFHDRLQRWNPSCEHDEFYLCTYCMNNYQEGCPICGCTTFEIIGDNHVC
jgi:hypothetical protein